MGCHSSKELPLSATEPITVSTPVTLNVYDLTPLNKYTYWFGIGIFHTGIEVYGMEYGFGAHDYPRSGVFELEPKCCPGFYYRRSILLGHTNMLPLEFQEFMESIAGEYYGDTYDLILKNCNHFTNDVSLRLTGKPNPKWVNRLANISTTCSCLVPKSFRIAAVEDPETHGLLLDDASVSFGIITPVESTGSESGDNDMRFNFCLEPSLEQLTFTKLRIP